MSEIIRKLEEARKALVGGLVSAAAAVTAANVDGEWSIAEWSTVGQAVVGLVGGFAAVWFTSNKAPAEPAPLPPPDVNPVG